jgi:hypothetical protein
MKTGQTVAADPSPDLNDVRRILATAWYHYRKMKGLDPSYYRDFDQVTAAYLMDLVKREKYGAPPDSKELLKASFLLSPLG